MRDLRIFPERASKAGRAQLSALMERAKALAGRKPEPPSSNVVVFSRLDRVVLDSQKAKWPRYRQLVERGVEKVPDFEDLLADLFYGLYLHDPEIRPRNAMLPSHRINHDLFTQTQRLSLWEEARLSAVLNPKHAIIGLVYVAQALLDAIDPDAAEEQREQAEAAAEAQDRQDDASATLDELIEHLAAALDAGDLDADDGQGPTNPFAALIGAGSVGGTATAPTDAEMDALAAIAAQLDDIDADLQPAPDDAPAADDIATRIAARDGLKQATEALDELDQMLTQWGSDPGEFNALDPEEAFDLFERMKSLPNIADFTLELGRMRNAGLDAQMQSNAREPQEIVDVTTGRSWADVLPSERVLLGDERTAPLFWARMMQEGLLTWAYAGREPANRGPFILLVDVSGSTVGAPERWGKAFALAALEMAKRDHRDCGVIFFDRIVRPEGVFTFPGGRVSLPEKVAVASYFTGGGTDWEIPLSLALANIEATDGAWQRADVVLVTDGECEVGAEFAADYRRRCQARGIRTHGVLLDLAMHYEETMKPFADRIFSVRSLGGHESARPIFDALAN